MKLSKAQRRALVKAMERPRKTICPIPGVHAAAEQTLLDAMDRRGLIAWDGPVPFISEAGIAALEAERCPA